MSKRYFDKMQEESVMVRKSNGKVVTFAGKGAIEYAEKYIKEHKGATIAAITTVTVEQ
jgi:hypothetical protein